MYSIQRTMDSPDQVPVSGPKGGPASWLPPGEDGYQVQRLSRSVLAGGIVRQRRPAREQRFAHLLKTGVEQWQCNTDTQPRGGHVECFYRTPVLRHGALGDGQPEAEAATFTAARFIGTVEGAKNRLQL